MKKYDYFASPDPERPKMIIRLRSGHEAPEIWNELFEELKKCRDICDEVWFSTGIAFPALDEHRKKSELFAKHAAQLRSIGIIPSLQIQATLGHGDRTFADNSLEGKTWGNYVGRNGEISRTCNCPNQPGFINYMAEVARIYATWQPGSVWIDDDLRLNWHWPANGPGGCHCDDCIAAFSKLENKNFSRAGLVEACDNDPELNSRWLRFATRSVTNLVDVIVKSVQQVSPGSRFGLQHGNRPERIDVLQTLAGSSGAKVGTRPGGGVDSDQEPHWIIDKAYLCSLQTYKQPGYEIIGQNCPEIESYPRTFCCKTAHGLRIETMLYLALGGGDSMSYFVMDPICEEVSWYGKNLLAPLAEDAPVVRDFIRRNENSIPSGVGRLEKSCYTFRTQNLGFPLIGIPQAGYAPGSKCLQLTAFAVNEMDDEKLEAVLKHHIILDGAAAEKIIERGFGDHIGNIAVSELDRSIFDYCTNDPLNGKYSGMKNFPFSDERYVFKLPAELNCRILSIYRDGKMNECGVATVIFERQDNTRCALIGYDGFHTRHLPSSRVMMLNNIADWVSGNTLPAVPQEAVQTLLVPRCGKQGNLHTVTILNVTIGAHPEFKLKLRNVPENSKITWNVPAKAPQTVEFLHDGEDIIVTEPEIPAWGIGYLAFD